MDSPAEQPPFPGERRGRRLLGRRGFVATLLAGTAVSAAAAGRALPGPPAAAAAELLPGMTILDGPGVDPSGRDDSTSGLQALVDGSPEGAALWLPAGRYLVDGLVLHGGQSLSGPPARSYLGSGQGGAHLQARRPGGSAPVLTVGTFGQVADISVAGNGRTRPAVRAAGFGVVLHRVTMLEGSVGFDGAYAGGCQLVGCMVHENVVGIADLVDSTVQSCVVNANRGNGISLGEGANANVLTGNRIEWNDGHGVEAYRTEHTVVLGGIVDRNGLTGIRLVDCAHTSVVGGVFRRNGRLADDGSDDDCHVFEQNCTGLVVTGLSTDHGADDDGGGRRSPGVAIGTSGGSGVTLVGNDLSGRLSGVAVTGDATDADGARLLNGELNGVRQAGATRVPIGTGELDLAAGGSGAAAFELGVPMGGVASYRLHLVWLDRRTGARGLGETVLLVCRDTVDAQVAVGTVEDRLGDAFGGGRYRIGAAISADGARLTVTVRNGGSAPARMALELT